MRWESACFPASTSSGRALRIVETKPRAAKNAQSLPLSGVRIFFAEDGPDNQRLIAHHLRKSAAQVTIFDNGTLCFDALMDSTHEPATLRSPAPCDLVLTDMQMPVMDGYTLARRLRAAGWTQPIIALTAHAMHDDIEKCTAAGCDGYASKPIVKERLVQLCQEKAHLNVAPPRAA